MAASSFEHAEEARAALLAIVSDPEHGADALSSVQTVVNLLQDLLPDAPREAGLLTAAVTAGLPAMLRSYTAQGLDGETAVSLAAAAFADRTAFTPDASEWVAAELAVALGLEVGGRGAVRAVPPVLGAGAQVARTAAWLGRDTLSLTTIEPGISAAAGRPSTRGSRKFSRLVLALGLTVVVIAGGVAYAISHRSPQHRTPASGLAVITPDSLGAVRLGMTISQASAAAGVPLHFVGGIQGTDYFPRGSSPDWYVTANLASNTNPDTADPTVECIYATGGAETHQGIAVGASVVRLVQVYGASLISEPSKYLPQVPSSYVLASSSGDLRFYYGTGARPTVQAIVAGPAAVCQFAV